MTKAVPAFSTVCTICGTIITLPATTQNKEWLSAYAKTHETRNGELHVATVERRTVRPIPKRGRR